MPKVEWTKAYVLQMLALAVTYVVTGQLSFAMSQEHAIITISLFAPEGFALAAVLLFGARLWPGIFVGQFVLAMMNGLDAFSSFGIASINSAEAVLAVWLVHRFALNIKLKEPRDFLGLFALIVLILQPFSAISGSTVLLLSSVTNGDDLLKNILSWWFGNAMAQLIFTPLLLLLYHEWKRIHIRHLLLVGFVVFVVNYAFLVWIPTDSLPVMLLMTLPLLALLTLYRGLLCALIATTMLTLSSLYATHQGLGFFTHKSMFDNIIELNFFILSHFLMVVTIGSLVSERNRLREQAYEARQEQVLGTLVGGVAHHLNNDLSVILGNISLAMTELEDGSIKKMLALAERRGLESADMIKQLLVFARKEHISREYLELNEYLSSTLRLLQQAGHYQNMKFELHVTEEPLYAYADASRLYQVLLQVLNNAEDAMQGQDEAKVRIVLERQGNEACLRVQDEGRGMCPHHLDYIFAPFFTSKDVGEGTGLGLAVVMGIIKAHGGRIEVETAVNQGTTVSIYLPLAEADNSQA